MHFPTWLVGPLTKIGEIAYDRLGESVGIRVESRLGFTQSRYADPRDYVLVTVYNRTDKPESVQSVFLLFSHKAGALILPVPVGPFLPLPQIVTRTQNYVFGFPLDDVQAQLRHQRKQQGNPKLTVKAAGVHLASGRTVTGKAEFKLD
jgi:hypothetical protein